MDSPNSSKSSLISRARQSRLKSLARSSAAHPRSPTRAGWSLALKMATKKTLARFRARLFWSGKPAAAPSEIQEHRVQPGRKARLVPRAQPAHRAFRESRARPERLARREQLVRPVLQDQLVLRGLPVPQARLVQMALLGQPAPLALPDLRELRGLLAPLVLQGQRVQTVQLDQRVQSALSRLPLR